MEVYTVQPEKSIFAVITEKRGVLSSFAHDHFIAATNYDATLNVEDKTPATAKGTFSLSFPVKNLRIDDPDLIKQWFPLLKDLGVHKEPFSILKDDERQTIYQNALAKDQLDAEAYPNIEVTVITVTPSKLQTKKPDSYTAEVVFNIHGKKVNKKVPTVIQWSFNTITVESFGSFKFSDFDITPYSAMMGAVGNNDDVQFFTHIVAEKKSL